VESERRKKRLDAMQQTLNQLNHSQSFMLGQLSEQGAELAFARKVENGHLAVVQLHGRLVTIDAQGHVDQSPDITVRTS